MTGSETLPTGTNSPRLRRLFHQARTSVLTAFLVISLLLLHVGEAEAAWTASNYHNAALTSGVVNPVPTLSCNAPSGLIATSIGFTWTAPASGLTPTSYTLNWSGTAGSGSANFPGTSGAITGGTLSVLGTTTVTVIANYNSWTSPVSLQSRLVTTIAVLGAIVSWTCA